MKLFQKCQQIISVIFSLIVYVYQIKSTKHSKDKERLLGRNVINFYNLEVERSSKRPMSLSNIIEINLKISLYLCKMCHPTKCNKLSFVATNQFKRIFDRIRIN